VVCWKNGVKNGVKILFVHGGYSWEGLFDNKNENIRKCYCKKDGFEIELS